MTTITNHTMYEEYIKPFILDNDQLEALSVRLLQEMNKGLGRDTNKEATVKMFPTYVRNLPNGNERGRFLALDLGGTNFRVLLIRLSEGRTCQMESKIFAIPQQIMQGTGEALFDHIAECLAAFVRKHNIQDTKLPLGFTFSFPCSQEGLTKARLVQWTKGFKCSGVEGEDVVQLLEEAVDRKGANNIEVCAVLNDTTGSLMSCAYHKPTCEIGLIVGTGTNACYMERLENVHLWNGSYDEPRQVIVNTEWGAFGDNGALDLVLTEYDRTLDSNSMNKGRQLFEKMISGMYMGELVRLALEKMTQRGLLFRGVGSEFLYERERFFTKYVSEIETDDVGSYTNMRQILDELGLSHATDEDCFIVRRVCEVVSRRAAHLVSMGVATLINKINKPFVTVAVDGSVYRFHPFFHDLMKEKITELLNPGLKFDLMLSEDGSGRGAALVAAVASYNKKIMEEQQSE